KMVADFWYSCWIDAGKPDLFSENSSLQIVEEEYPDEPKIKNFQNEEFITELPEEQKYPNREEEAWKETQEAKDFFTRPNPFFDPAGGNKNNDLMQNNDKPLPGFDLPEEIKPNENMGNSKNDTPYTYDIDDYSNNHPLDKLFLEEDNPTVDRKESKYERKLRIKKQKAKRKQEKLRKEMEATKKEIQDLNESMEYSRIYPYD
ncbi:MAG: hypothetical protein ACPGVB_12030, partial [Chitinophagales bacterium]